jgi:hypothetical protein
MSEENKVYSNEMRGSLWMEKERKSDKAPISAGTITISGVELRLAMWPKRKAGGTGKRAGEEFWPVSVEYKQGTKFVLAKVNPANIVVTGAAADAAADMPAAAAAADVDNVPF